MGPAIAAAVIGSVVWVALSYGVSQMASVSLVKSLFIVAIPMTWVILTALTDAVREAVGWLEALRNSIKEPKSDD